MANNQIEKYRLAFDKMSASQKKAFIENLRKQIQGKNLPTYKRFLDECVQKYNANNSLDNLLNNTVSQSKTVTTSTLKIWTVISVAASVLFQFVMPFAAQYGVWKRTNIFGYTERHADSYLGYETYIGLLNTFITTTPLEILCYIGLAGSIILAVAILFSNWKTKTFVPRKGRPGCLAWTTPSLPR